MPILNSVMQIHYEGLLAVMLTRLHDSLQHAVNDIIKDMFINIYLTEPMGYTRRLVRD
jgi:hypothetical protein